MSYITFREAPPNPKTQVWDVVAKEDGTVLGQVRFFGRWRQYSFFPEPKMVFERTCLRDIADFCERKSKELRLKWKREQP